MRSNSDLAPDPATLRASMARGLEWIEVQQQPDGAFVGSEGDLAGYYKSLLTLSACGRIEAAARCRQYVRAHFRASDGALSSGHAKTGIARMARNLANYMDGWVAIGAWSSEDFELAEQIANRLRGSQCESHGGVLTGPEQWSGAPRYDLATAASCGRAFLFCGHRDEALAVGRFLVSALEHQSSPSDGLDLVFDDAWVPIHASDPGERTYYYFDLSRRGEKVWFPAFASAFLSELHQISGQPDHLAAARRYYEFVEQTPEYRDGSLANGKSGWSAGLLVLATGSDDYRAALRRIAGNVLNRQAQDGEFVAASNAARATTPSGSGDMPRRLERTAEFTLWVAEYLRFSAEGVMTDRAE